MAVTLAQLAKLEDNPLRKAIIMNLLREISLMEWLPFENVNALQTIAVRAQYLPSVAFRGINEGYTASEGDYEQVWESVYGLGGDINIDRVFDKVTNTIIPVAQSQITLKMKALALTFNHYFINGDHATDAKGFEGLKKRIDGYPSRQSVYFAASNAAALDVTGSVANANTFFTKLEELHKRTNGGQVNALLVNENMQLGIGRAARYINASGGMFLDITKDSFDRDILTYKGAPVIDVGIKTDQSTEIITDSETAGDAGTDATSIYGVSFGVEQGITGIQLGGTGPDIYDPLSGGEMEAKPTRILRMDWWLGLAGFGSYGITRGRNVEGASNWTA